MREGGNTQILGLVLPGSTALLILFLLPAIVVVFISLTDWQLGAPSMNWIGIGNYVALAADDEFLHAAGNTILYALMVVPGTLVMGFLIAATIQAGRPFRSFYRALHFLPYMATLSAMAIVWEALLHPTMGLINHLLQHAGLHGANWLRDPATVLPVLAAIEIWRNLGYAMVLYLAGFNGVSNELYEAAALDGAGAPLSRLRLVTLPQIAPITLFLIVVTTLRALSSFTKVAVLTQGGPNHASDVILYQMFSETFEYFQAGYGAAMTCVFLLIVGCLSAVQLWIGERNKEELH